MTPEGIVKSKVKQQLLDMGAYYFMPATHGYGRSGIPDIVGSYKGYFFAIECKAKNGKPTALQERELRRIRDAGGIALVVNEENMNEIQNMLRSVAE